MVYFFRRGAENLSSETRFNPDGPGYQLAIMENGHTRIESFAALSSLLTHEHELLRAWRAQGWQDVGRPAKTPVDTSSGRN